jgi:hypothetical protein
LADRGGLPTLFCGGDFVAEIGRDAGGLVTVYEQRSIAGQSPPNQGR